MAAATSRWLVPGSVAETGGQRVLLQFRFPLRMLFVQLRVHDAGAGQRRLCEHVEVAQELAASLSWFIGFVGDGSFIFCQNKAFFI